MNPRGKVIWREGLFLQPQHFQWSDTSARSEVHTRISSVSPFGYGLLRVSIRKESLAHNRFELVGAAGVMPDGTPFDFSFDQIPAARELELSHEQQFVSVFLALPKASQGRSSVGQKGEFDKRYVSSMEPISDEFSTGNRKEIEVGRYQFRLLTDQDMRDDYETIQIARIKRSESGELLVDDSFIPPALRIDSSPYLISQLQSLLQMLLAKQNSLSQNRKQGQGGEAEFSEGEIAAFNLLLVINSYAPLLNAYAKDGRVSTYELFYTLTQFTGALSTFAADISLSSFPAYVHDDFAGAWGTFDRLIRQVLGLQISSNCVTLPVREVDAARYEAKLPDPGLVDSCQFFLGISSPVSEKQLIVGTLPAIKIASSAELDFIISSAMPGIPIFHIAATPSGLSTKPNYVYFSLDKNSNFWSSIQANRSISFYFPHDFPDCKMEILALKG